jgi:hypothetical protein
MTFQDRLGLRAMDMLGKLHFLSVEGDHLQFGQSWFIDNIVNKFMKAPAKRVKARFTNNTIRFNFD